MALIFQSNKTNIHQVRLSMPPHPPMDTSVASPLCPWIIHVNTSKVSSSFKWALLLFIQNLLGWNRGKTLGSWPQFCSSLQLLVSCFFWSTKDEGEVNPLPPAPPRPSTNLRSWDEVCNGLLFSGTSQRPSQLHLPTLAPSVHAVT